MTINLPKKKFTDGNRKMISLRLPESLIGQIEKRSLDIGMTKTDLIQSVMDLYLQQVEEED